MAGRFIPIGLAGDAYGMIYGPLLYFVNGVFLLLSPTIFMSKLSGVVAWLAAVGFFWRSLRKRGIDSYTACLFVAVLCAALMPEQQYPYSNRADSYLLLLVSLSLMVVTEWPARAATWGMGTLAGLAVGFKLHGISYAVPAMFNLAARGENQVRRIGALVAICAVAALVIAIIHSNTAMVAGYAKYLAVASRHGLAMEILKDNARFALCYSTLPAVLWMARRPVLRREDARARAVPGAAEARRLAARVRLNKLLTTTDKTSRPARRAWRTRAASRSGDGTHRAVVRVELRMHRGHGADNLIGRSAGHRLTV
jgi:hypothetical protein